MPASLSLVSSGSASKSENTRSTSSMTFSRLRTRSALVANSGRAASIPNVEANVFQSFSLPTLICTLPCRQWNSP